MVESISIPVELLEQFERGNVLLFVGEGINQDALPSSAELAQELGARCDYPPEEPLTLPRVAGYYELTRDRHGLVQFLRDRLDSPALAPPRAHTLAVQLRPRVIVTTCYDRLLERALREADIPYTAVVGNAEVAYAEEHKVLLAWLWGVFDQPDSIVVTEDDRRLFLEGRANLSDVLRAELARRTWLFVGFDAEDEWFRGFYDSVSRGLDRHRQRAYIVGATPGAYTCAWWKKRNAEILSAEVESFLTALTDRLAARARPEIPAPRPITAPAEPLPLPEEPYKALVSYETKDRAMFFGRDCETEELTALVHAYRLVLLYGASGVGKTSLLQAGVIPRLEEAEPGYTVVTVRALTDPVTALRAALRRKLPDVELPADDTPLVGFLAAATRIGERPLVLVIDQFEEFFICLSPEYRAEFIAELGALYDARDLPVKVVLSLREDYLASVSELEHRIPEVFHTRMRLLPLTREQARDAVVCPVEALGYTYEPSLVERLLDDLEREGVMPPHLQLVCNALFHRTRAEGRKTVTVADYEALGGVQGVLRGYLDEELRHLPAEEQALAHDLLEELVTSERTKKVETLTELRTALNADPAILDAVVEKLVRARLLRSIERSDTPERAYELAHEYLIDEIVLSPEVMVCKEAEELLDREVLNWQRLGTLMSVDRLLLVLDRVEITRLEPEEIELLLRSALQHNWGDESLWTSLWEAAPRETLLTNLLLLDPPLVARAREWAARMGTRSSSDHGLLVALVHTALEDSNMTVRDAALDSLNAQGEDVFALLTKRAGIRPAGTLTEARQPGSSRKLSKILTSIANWQVVEALGILGMWAALQVRKGNLYFLEPIYWHIWPIFWGAFLLRLFELAIRGRKSESMALRGSIYAALAFLIWVIAGNLYRDPVGNAMGTLLGMGISFLAFRRTMRMIPCDRPSRRDSSNLWDMIEWFVGRFGPRVTLSLHVSFGAALGSSVSPSIGTVLQSIDSWAEALTNVSDSILRAAFEAAAFINPPILLIPTAIICFLLLGLVALKIVFPVVRVIVDVAFLTVAGLIQFVLMLLTLLWFPVLFVSLGLSFPMWIERPKERLHLHLAILMPIFLVVALTWMIFAKSSFLGSLLGLLVWSLLFGLILWVTKTREWHLGPVGYAGSGFLLGMLVTLALTAELDTSLSSGLIAGGLAIGVGEIESASVDRSASLGLRK